MTHAGTRLIKTSRLTLRRFTFLKLKHKKRHISGALLFDIMGVV